MVSTRNSTEVWLVGHRAESLSGCKLPCARQVLQRMLYLHTDEKKTLRESAKLTVQECFVFWKQGGIPVQEERNAIEVVLRLHKEWVDLYKDKKRVSELHEGRRAAFTYKLDSTLDFAHYQAEKILEDNLRREKNEKTKLAIAEDLQFYRQQRESREGYMAKIDTNAVKKFEKQQRATEKKEATKRRYETVKKEIEAQFVKVELEGEDDGGSEGDNNNNDKEFQIEGPKIKFKKEVSAPSLCAALDRNALSKRGAARVIMETAKALGEDTSNLNISANTLYRRRQENRVQTEVNFLENFPSSGPIVLHFDGKNLPNDQGEIVDRVAMVVKDLQTGEEQLLGIPSLTSGTGKAQAEAAVALLRKRGLADRVVGSSFDTTSSNTGPFIGACTLLAEFLGRPLLRLACRHHFLELPIKSAFDQLVGPSKSPIIPLFERFQGEWKNINQENYVTAVQLQAIRRIQDADDIIVYCEKLLDKDICPRDDYMYYLKYTITFLGGVPPGGVKFYKPGAVSRARFMGRALYCLLIAMFSNQFELSDEERTCVIEVSMYAVTAHLKPWFESNIPCRAPSIDLDLVKKYEFELSRHKKNDARKTLWRTAGYKFLAHLWYLSPELVPIALFDDSISNEDKGKIVAAMDRPTDTEDLPHKAFIPKLDKSVQNLELWDFANEGSLQLFKKLGVKPDFLNKNPLEWKDDISYKTLSILVSNLPTTNDAAERGVGLAHQFNNILTKSESQKQGLYLVVAKDRKLNKQK